MAYFPNGTSGDVYLEDWCFRCKNWKLRKDDFVPDCPIWDAHTLTSYPSANNELAKEILNILIPMDKEGIYPIRCRMFEWNGKCRGQMTF